MSLNPDGQSGKGTIQQPGLPAERASAETGRAQLPGRGGKKLLGFLLGPALFVIALLLPPPTDVPEVGMRSLGIFLWVICWWILETIPIPATSFLALGLLVVCGVFPAQVAFGYWASWVNIFLIGAFIIGQAMNIHGLNQRFAYWMVSRPFIGNSSWRFMVALLSACALLSAIASNTVCTIIFTSVALSFIKDMNIDPHSRFSVTLLICVPWAGSIGGTATPVGAATHLYTIGILADLNYRIGFLHWMMFGVPVMILAMAAMFLVIKFVLRPELGEIQVTSAFARQELAKLGSMKRAEKISAAVLLVALAFWMLPDLLPLFVGHDHQAVHWLQTYLTWPVVAIFAAVALFLIPINWREREFAMTWDQAVAGIHWGVLALVAGALAIGNALSSQEVGLGLFFSRALNSISEPYVLVPVGIVVIALLTNFASNFATLSAIVPVAIVIASDPNSGINPVAMTLCLGLGAAWAFALPLSTPINAIPFASGFVRISTMFKGGMVLALLCTLFTILLAYPLANWIFSWPR